jgi:hypothetical protein
MKALAKSVAAPSGVDCPVGNPSVPMLNFELDAETAIRDEINHAARKAMA